MPLDTCGVWTRLPSEGAPSPRYDHAMVWTGRYVVIWGGERRHEDDSMRYLGDGARYDPATNTWLPMSTRGAPSARTVPIAVWTGSHVLVWGGYDGNFLADGALYHPEANEWSSMDDGGTDPPAERSNAAHAWTGTSFLVWGGWGPYNDSVHGDGASWSDGMWSPLPRGSMLAARRDPAFVWTGAALWIWGGEGADGTAYN
ncbi:MAG: hypothetical protein NZ898_17355, partial [Myxococcota bacterium]|nr:hypothetical protein [Myxococcota bacterium]